MMNSGSTADIGTVATIDISGLSVRYARGGASSEVPILLTAPWPESIYAFHRVLPRIGSRRPWLAVDLPGFGLSQSRPEVMAPEAMGGFLVTLLQRFGISRTHVLAPDVGAPAVLFAAAKQQDLFESLALGSAATRADLAGSPLKDLIQSTPGALAGIDGAEALKDYFAAAAQITPAAIIDDFRRGSAGRRFEDAVQYVRGYLTDLPKLESLLSTIKTPVLIIAGKNDPIVPPSNGQVLADRLPHNRYVLLDAAHRVWEEATEEYAAAVRSWFDGEYRTYARP